MTPHEAFFATYGGQVTFYKDDVACAEDCFGQYDWIGEEGTAGIRVYTNANITWEGAGHRWAVHEMGHFFEARVNGYLGNNHIRNRLGNHDAITRRGVDNDVRLYGFADFRYGWQQSPQATTGEEFADMFLGWTYNRWETRNGVVVGQGVQRSAFMEMNMSLWVTVAAGN